MNELKPMGIGVFAPSVGVSYPKIQTYAISDYSDWGGGRGPDLSQIRGAVQMPSREGRVRSRQNVSQDTVPGIPDTGSTFGPPR